ncbi:hypothetical protein HAX54_044824, partial [Datura stramonium]|nr:hypothetical protein [Datura stramonium]
MRVMAFSGRTLRPEEGEDERMGDGEREAAGSVVSPAFLWFLPVVMERGEEDGQRSCSKFWWLFRRRLRGDGVCRRLLLVFGED